MAATATRNWADACFDALQAIATRHAIVQRHPGRIRSQQKPELELELADGPARAARRRHKQQLERQGLLPQRT